MNRQLKNALKGLTAPDAERRRRAMEPFIRATFDSFIRYLYRYLGNEVECEDVLEDVYADIWENPERLRNVTTERELLRTVYLYYMRKRLRRVYRRMNRHLYLAQKDMENLVAPELGTLEMLSRTELRGAHDHPRQAIQIAIGHLEDVLHNRCGTLLGGERNGAADREEGLAVDDHGRGLDRLGRGRGFLLLILRHSRSGLP